MSRQRKARASVLQGTKILCFVRECVSLRRPTPTFYVLHIFLLFQQHPGHEYRPPPPHLPLETTLHWLSNGILCVFALELLVVLYAMGVQQFCCACRAKIHEDDIVVVQVSWQSHGGYF